ncbi:MAG: CAP domain-containing protein [Deltaproteobacteria bacterium]
MTRLLAVLALAAAGAFVYFVHDWSGAWVLGLTDDTRLIVVAVSAVAAPLFLAVLVRFNTARWSFVRVFLLLAILVDGGVAAALATRGPRPVPLDAPDPPEPAPPIAAPPPAAAPPPFAEMPDVKPPAPEPAPPAKADTFYRYIVDGQVVVTTRIEDVPPEHRAAAEVTTMERSDDPSPPPASPRAALVADRLNLRRRALGLAPVTVDAKKTAGAAAHAAYIAANHTSLFEAGLALHDEDESRPGYSAAGAHAGRHAVIALQEGRPRDVVDQWMASFFHRVPLVHPRLERVGVGFAERGGQRIFVVDVEPEAPSSRVVVVPADGARDVPIAFAGPELPNPIPNDPDGAAGYPITVTFPPKAKVGGVVAKLSDLGAEVPAWVSTPVLPADAKAQQNTVCLIAKDPLRPRTRYTFEMRATVDGRPFTLKSTFTTR